MKKKLRWSPDVENKLASRTINKKNKIKTKIKHVVRFRAPTRLKKVWRLSRDGWHLLVHYTWRQRGLDGTTQLLSNPENKPVKRALHTALLSSETAWPAFGPAHFFFFFFPFHIWSQHEWVSEALIWLLLSVRVRVWRSRHSPERRAGEGGDVGQKRGQYSKKGPRNKRNCFGLRCDRKSMDDMEDRKLKQLR